MDDPRSGAPSPTAPERAPAQVPVRVRRVLRPDGETRTELTVRCHRRDGVVSYSDCAECGHRLTLPGDPTEEAAAVSCQSPDPSAPEAPRPRTLLEIPHQALHAPVREVMTRSVVCATPEVPLRVLITVLAEEGVGGMPVVDGQGAPIGMVSQSDLVWEGYERLEDDEEEPTLSLDPETPVGKLMTPTALSVTEHTSVAEAAAVMSFEGIHRLPVVDEHNRVVGLVTALDLLAWISRQAGYAVPLRVPRGRRTERSQPPSES